MQSVAVVGNCGSGKSTLAARLARRLDAPHIELDAIYHQAGWVALPDADLIRAVDERTRGARWVVDGNYPVVRDLVWSRADTVIWLDLPRPVVAARVVWRTLRRLALRTELWNGNREPWANLTSFDPDRSIVAWSLARHAHYRATYGALMKTRTDLRFERIASRRDLRRLFERIG